MKRIKFHTPEMGEVGQTRWFEASEPMPTLDWSKVSAVETAEDMTVEQFKAKFPEIKPSKIKDFPGRVVEIYLKTTGKLPDETAPTANTPAGIRWWAKQCANYGGLERAFNEAANALEKALKK